MQMQSTGTILSTASAFARSNVVEIGWLGASVLRTCPVFIFSGFDKYKVGVVSRM
jgi:hypothetical protein